MGLVGASRNGSAAKKRAPRRSSATTLAERTNVPWLLAIAPPPGRVDSRLRPDRPPVARILRPIRLSPLEHLRTRLLPRELAALHGARELPAFAAHGLYSLLACCLLFRRERLQPLLDCLTPRRVGECPAHDGAAHERAAHEWSHRALRLECGCAHEESGGDNENPSEGLHSDAPVVL